ncbi:hypothetical protein AVEN_97204-1 [Araneus ventricosus]|uniref:Gustatory receptor n=1 Tax=Araneus ventricosus TaxID=182803 RepID=A0A4Y2JQ47_ARAVE|nr:hypothetical protein AVEN_97204-1 [Araneus ventricosus]
MFTNALLIILWYIFLYRKKNLQPLLNSSKSCPKRAKKHRSQKCKRLTNLFLILVFIIPVGLATIYAYLAHETEDEAALWTYGYDIYDKRYRAAANFICSYAYFANYVGFPCLVTLTTCMLVHRYGHILFRLKKSFKVDHTSNACMMYSRILEDYRLMEEKFRVLQDSLSVPLFLLLSICFLNLFSVLSAGLQFEIAAHHMVEMCSSTATGIIILFSLAFFCCKVPEEILEIKTALGSLIDKQQFSYLKGVKDVFLLHRVEKKDVAHLSACGIIDFKRSFLPSAIGALFTYGLLITNLKIKRD